MDPRSEVPKGTEARPPAVQGFDPKLDLSKHEIVSISRNELFGLSAAEKGVAAALLAFGGLLGGTLPSETTHHGEQARPAQKRTADLTNPGTRLDDRITMEELILNSFNPELTDYQRQSTERELARTDPGGRNLVRIAKEQLRNLPSNAPEWKREALNLFIQTREVGIEFPGRMSRSELPEIIRNRQNLTPDGRPLAVMVYGKGDWNGAFYTAPNIFKELIDAGYRVMYIEVESDMQFCDQLKAATGLGTAREQKADILMFGGHGSKTSLWLERDGFPQEGDHGKIDFADREMFQRAGIREVLKKDGQIVLDSCSNGEGREGANNMANFVRAIFPGAKKQGIWSATESYGPISLHFSNSGELIEVRYPVPVYRANHGVNGRVSVNNAEPRYADLRRA